MSDYEGVMDDWQYFMKNTKNHYGVDMSVLTKPFSEEQKKYYLQTSLWNNLHPNQVIGTATIIKEIDCLTVIIEEILVVTAAVLSSIIKEETRLCSFSGWFNVHFRVRGSKENPAEQEIELTTEPSEDNTTHWGQQAVAKSNNADERLWLRAILLYQFVWLSRSGIYKNVERAQIGFRLGSLEGFQHQ